MQWNKRPSNTVTFPRSPQVQEKVLATTACVAIGPRIALVRKVCGLKALREPCLVASGLRNIIPDTMIFSGKKIIWMSLGQSEPSEDSLLALSGYDFLPSMHFSFVLHIQQVSTQFNRRASFQMQATVSIDSLLVVAC